MLPFVGHTRPVRAAAFAPDGLTLVSAGDDGKVIVWDRLDAAARHVIPVGFNAVRAVACHPDGERFCAPWRYTSVAARAARAAGAAADQDRVRFWRLDTGRVAEDHEPGEAKYWHMLAGADPQEVAVENSEAVTCLAFTPDGGRLFCFDVLPGFGSWNPLPLDRRWVPEYDVSPPRERSAGGWVGRRRGVQAFALSADGAVAAVATKDWVRAGPVGAVRVPPGYATQGAVQSLALTPGGGMLAGCWQDVVTVWDTAGGGTVREFRGHTAPVEAVAAHPSEPLVASAGRDGAVVLWEPASGAVRGRYDWGLGPVHALAFAPDGLTLAVAGDGGLVCFDLD